MGTEYGGVYILTATAEERYRDYIRASGMRWVLIMDLFLKIHPQITFYNKLTTEPSSNSVTVTAACFSHILYSRVLEVN